MTSAPAKSTGGNDSPITSKSHDDLGFEVYVDALSEFILSCDTPMTVAIQGDWGSGKTSLMNLIRAGVTGSADQGPRVRCVWINTWQFSQFDMGAELPFSVISLFTRQLAGDQPAVRDVLRSVRDLAMRAGKGAAVMATAFYAGAESAEALAKLATGPEQQDGTQRISEMRERLQALVRGAREKEGIDRFVVFVDDIDRLVPERAVELLEVLKVFLDLEGCVFVLACDYQVVSRGLRSKFGADSSDLKGKHFFDKIIQLPFSMPVGQMEVADYLRKRLQDCGIDLQDDNSSELAFYEGLLAHSVGFNPRGLKRLTNCLRILRLVAERKCVLVDTVGQGTKVERERALFAALCMQTAFEPLYMALIEVASWPGVDFKHVIRILSGALQNKAPAAGAVVPTDRFEVRLVAAVKGCDTERPGSAQSIPLFIGALTKALQIKTGLSDELEPQEVAMFVSMLRFAAITATSSAGGDRAQSVDLSAVRPIFLALRKRLEAELNLNMATYDDTDGAWVGAKVPHIGFIPYLGVDQEGALCFSADVSEGARSAIARENAKVWCRDFLEARIGGPVQIKKGNAWTGVVSVQLAPPGFAASPTATVQAKVDQVVAGVYAPLVEHIKAMRGKAKV